MLVIFVWVKASSCLSFACPTMSVVHVFGQRSKVIQCNTSTLQQLYGTHIRRSEGNRTKTAENPPCTNFSENLTECAQREKVCMKPIKSLNFMHLARQAKNGSNSFRMSNTKERNWIQFPLWWQREREQKKNHPKHQRKWKETLVPFVFRKQCWIRKFLLEMRKQVVFIYIIECCKHRVRAILLMIQCCRFYHLFYLDLTLLRCSAFYWIMLKLNRKMMDRNLFGVRGMGKRECQKIEWKLDKEKC